MSLHRSTSQGLSIIYDYPVSGLSNVDPTLCIIGTTTISLLIIVMYNLNKLTTDNLHRVIYSYIMIIKLLYLYWNQYTWIMFLHLLTNQLGVYSLQGVAYCLEEIARNNISLLVQNIFTCNFLSPCMPLPPLSNVFCIAIRIMETNEIVLFVRSA